MKMKPKSTVHNNKALVYRRFIGLEKSVSLAIIYKTLADNKYWTFDCETQEFTEITATLVPQTSTIREITNQDVLTYLDNYYRYVYLVDLHNPAYWTWSKISALPSQYVLLSASFNNIGKYQTNKYYYVGSFDYMIKGGIEGTTTQYIKGNITPLTSLNIKYFNDYIDLRVDDLVVLEKHLFSVENPETVQKMQPKPLKIYFATLNSIL